ncbi:P-loop containing nucleoside triphosphate hydrolase protein [Flagelloscypha sp. PMI_526]|nr:P-loop containing nucleoside triphosphate hydrolase protein [Flagelloscypha sp. PMI_526]
MPRSYKRLKEVHCIVVGDRGIGQTCLIQRMATGCYYGDFQDPTIEDTWRFQSNSPEGPFVVWLYETFGSLIWEPTTYYADIGLVLLCFSVEDHRSFESVVEKWSLDLQNYAPSARVILVGTKSDLRISDDVIEALRLRHQGIIHLSQGAALANKIGALGYVACSARIGEGLERLEELIVREGRRIDAINAAKIEAARKKKRKKSFCDIL